MTRLVGILLVMLVAGGCAADSERVADATPREFTWKGKRITLSAPTDTEVIVEDDFVDVAVGSDSVMVDDLGISVNRKDYEVDISERVHIAIASGTITVAVDGRTIAREARTVAVAAAPRPVPPKSRSEPAQLSPASRPAPTPTMPPAPDSLGPLGTHPL